MSYMKSQKAREIQTKGERERDRDKDEDEERWQIKDRDSKESVANRINKAFIKIRVR